MKVKQNETYSVILKADKADRSGDLLILQEGVARTDEIIVELEKVPTLIRKLTKYYQKTKRRIK